MTEQYLITVHKEVPATVVTATGDGGITSTQVFMARVETLDIAALSRQVHTAPRAPRVRAPRIDKGVPRGPRTYREAPTAG